MKGFSKIKKNVEEIEQAMLGLQQKLFYVFSTLFLLILVIAYSNYFAGLALLIFMFLLYDIVGERIARFKQVRDLLVENLEVLENGGKLNKQSNGRKTN